MEKKIIYEITSFGKLVKEKMINQSELCRKTGITRSRMLDLTKNLKSRMTIKEAYLICRALKMNLDKFIPQLI